MDLCCSKNRKNFKNDINQNDTNQDEVYQNDTNQDDIKNDNTFNIFRNIKNYIKNYTYKKKYNNISKQNENTNVSKILFERNNYRKKELNKNYLIYLRLKYPIVSIYDIPDSYKIVCNMCFKYTKEETYRVLPCDHYCHASCLDNLGKIYSYNMDYYGKYLIYNCKLCNKNIKL